MVVGLLTEKKVEKGVEKIEECNNDIIGVECTDMYNGYCEIFQLGDVVNRKMGEVPKVDDGCADGIISDIVTGMDSESVGAEVLAKTNIEIVQKNECKTEMEKWKVVIFIMILVRHQNWGCYEKNGNNFKST